MNPFAIALLVAVAPLAIANDGWVGISGSPKLMKGHPTIRMVSERIVAVIYSKEAHVTCDFVFKNEGAATTVRMGFPDDNSDNSFNNDSGKPITTFSSFVSLVDGRRTTTKIEAARDRSSFSAYQVKTVAFRKGQTRRVRNVYRIPLGDLALSSVAPGYPAIRSFDYVFSTGSSWKGTIGRSELTVLFSKSARVRGARIALTPWAPLDGHAYPVFTKNPSTVAYSGSLAWKVSGRKLVLVRKNWRPSEHDDVTLFFDAHIRAL